MNSSEIRTKFLEFFRARGHAIVPSDSLIPAKDPTLLFTGAGMNQFKENFLGVKRDLKRAASVQKCFRTGDVDQVGKTPSHLTFFEMLGNFSFGDYFKKEAIAYAWELMTQALRIPEGRLWVSVYEKDDEAALAWHQGVGLPKERIVRFGAKENFWPSNAPTEGPNGPCGPCSEIYYDYETCFVGKTCPDPDRCAPGCPCGRFVEVWNLVFTQYDRQPDGRLIDLPAKNIDTGMGMERLAAVMQGKMSVFETDLFEPIIEAVVHLLREEAPNELRRNQRADVYAIADHARALTFLIAEGLVPSNEGRGYVLRMLLRKAARAGRALGLKRSFLYRLSPTVVQIMTATYPELTTRRESISKVILNEEERFVKTLEEKIPLLRQEIRSALNAETAARFYDTHGISYEEIAEACLEEQVEPPTRAEFEEALAKLQSVSKKAGQWGGEIFARDQVQELCAGLPDTVFVGYEQLSSPAKVVGLVVENRLLDEVKGPARVGLILDRTPFYGESGGQVGDAGLIEGPSGKLKIIDTQWVGDLLFHEGELTEGKIRKGEPVTATVGRKRRAQVAANHTATHLVHAALRKVLGEHVLQAGSLVAPDRLRFDFSHSGALSGTQRRSVESLVNEWVAGALPVSVAEMSTEEAKAKGALALFGERYGSQVRVVTIGDVSKELCGGTHLKVTSEVGFLSLVEEGSVASGIRRVEAITGEKVLVHLKQESQALQELAETLKTPPEAIPQALERFFERVKSLEAELQRLRVKAAQDQAGKMLGKKVGTLTLVAEQIPGPVGHEGLRSLADAVRKTEPQAVLFLVDSEGCAIAAVSGGPQAQGITAKEVFQCATAVAGGSGGGRPELAQGRVNEPGRFPQIRERIEKLLLNWGHNKSIVSPE